MKIFGILLGKKKRLALEEKIMEEERRLKELDQKETQKAREKRIHKNRQIINEIYYIFYSSKYLYIAEKELHDLDPSTHKFDNVEHIINKDLVINIIIKKISEEKNKIEILRNEIKELTLENA